MSKKEKLIKVVLAAAKDRGIEATLSRIHNGSAFTKGRLDWIFRIPAAKGNPVYTCEVHLTSNVMWLNKVADEAGKTGWQFRGDVQSLAVSAFGRRWDHTDIPGLATVARWEEMLDVIEGILKTHDAERRLSA